MAARVETTPERIYRRQRHLYDLTRPLFLVGRDRLLRGIDAPDGAAVLEIGCGTARNLLQLSRRHPRWSLFGLDASPSMLRTAGRRIPAGLRSRIHLAEADATEWSARSLFQREARFDAIFLSYSLSMIARPRRALELAALHLAPGGSLHLVDFGDASIRRAPWSWGLGRWLEWWHVRPAPELMSWLEEIFFPPLTAPGGAADRAATGPALEEVVLRRGYARLVRVRSHLRPVR